MKISEYMARVGVPVKFLSADINNVDIFDNLGLPLKTIDVYKKHYSRCKKIVEDCKFGVVFEGLSGCGKTYLGCAMIREYLKNKYRCARTTTGEVLDWYFTDYQGLRERYIVADVLFLDDLTKFVFKTDVNVQVIEKLIRLRADSGKITLFSCFDENDITTCFSKDIYRLIMGSCIHLVFPEVDLRMYFLEQYAKEFD